MSSRPTPSNKPATPIKKGPAPKTAAAATKTDVASGPLAVTGASVAASKTAAPKASVNKARARPPPQSPEQKYLSVLKTVLSRLLGNAANEELALEWFIKRKEVHREEVDEVEDRYESIGMDNREAARKAGINEAFEGLTALQREPQKRQIVAELCQWLRYQCFPPRMIHRYPDELKTACEPASKPETRAQFVSLINGYFQQPPAGGAN